MQHILKLLRLAAITISIALIPAWPDLMGHASAFARQADSTQTLLCNSHYLLLAGMFMGGILLVVTPRMISEHLRASTIGSGLLGSAFLLAFGLGNPVVASCASVLTGVTVITLYGSTFYALAETANLEEISYVSACALALKALLLPAIGVELPTGASFWSICAIPLVSALLAAAYGLLCRQANVRRREEPGAMRSYGRRTSVFMAILICVSSIVFAVARASSNLQFWGSQNPLDPMPLVAAVSCTLVFLVVCYATFVCAPHDLMLRFMPCLIVQLVAYGLLWCGALPEIGVSDIVGEPLFCTYTELYSHMYFFMVMFVGLSMLGPAGVRVHGAQWAMFSATLFVVLALGLTAPTTTRFIVVLVMNAVLAAIFLLAHRAYSEDQVEAIKTVAAGPTNPHVANDPAPVSALTSTIESVSARYGLSEREREVLAMLAQKSPGPHAPGGRRFLHPRVPRRVLCHVRLCPARSYAALYALPHRAARGLRTPVVRGPSRNRGLRHRW